MAPHAKGLRRPDLAGNTVLPGLIDTHAHLLWTAPSLTALDVGEAEDHPALQSFVSQAAADSPPDQLILGMGFIEYALDTERFSPIIDALDAVAPENPVYLIGVTGHTSAVNSRALELLALPQRTPGLMRDAAGQPTGLLADEANASVDEELASYMHLAALNRGIMLTPFHHMALISPDTTEADIDYHTEVLRECTEAIAG